MRSIPPAFQKTRPRPSGIVSVPDYIDRTAYSKHHDENGKKVYDKIADPSLIYAMWVDQWISRGGPRLVGL